MANIKKHLDNIKGALFGKDVRSSIHDGIDAINKEVESTTNRQEHLEDTFDQLVINSGNSNAEIVDARVGENGKSYAKLGDRLDEVDSQLEQITNEIVPCSLFGFVSDYNGTPNYDGNDATRVTCTDNTNAFTKMLDYCEKVKNLKVYFPAGHYGIKEGNVVKNLEGCNLTIVGDGEDVTIIDYVKEDDTNTSYVDENKANYITRINSINSLKISNMTIKATTNYENINPNTTTSSEYNGAVWGLVIENFNTLRCENLKVERFNFRGISTNITKYAGIDSLNNRVELINCKGFKNRGSGFWIKFVKDLIINGGEYSYNGLIGHSGTGYGITASVYVANVVVQGSTWFHHNYRKGLDSHTQCNLTIDSAIFEDNVLFDIAILQDTKIEELTELTVNIKGTFKHGETNESLEWLRSCYSKIEELQATVNPTGGDTRYCSIKILDNASNPRVKSVSITANLNGAYNGYDVVSSPYNWAYTLQCPNADIKILNSNINLKNWKASPNDIALNACPFNITRYKKLSIQNSRITWLEDSTFDDSNQKGSLFYGSLTDKEVNFTNSAIEVNNSYLFATISNNTISDPGDNAGCIRTFENMIFKWNELPSSSSSERKLFGAQTLYTRNWKNNIVQIKDKYFELKTDSYNKQTINDNLKVINIDTDFLEIYLDNHPNRYILDVELRNDKLTILNGEVLVNGNNITLSSIEQIVVDNIKKTKVVIKSTKYTDATNASCVEVTFKCNTTGGTSLGIDSISFIN